MTDIAVPQWVTSGHLPHSIDMAVMQFREAVRGMPLTSPPEWANGPALKVKAAKQDQGGGGLAQASQGQVPAKNDMHLTDERVALDLLVLALEHAGPTAEAGVTEQIDHEIWVRYCGFLDKIDQAGQ